MVNHVSLQQLCILLVYILYFVTILKHHLMFLA